ncbi:MAG TPA: alpha/beta hydrolase [Usitatibacteraceae bacterium]
MSIPVKLIAAATLTLLAACDDLGDAPAAAALTLQGCRVAGVDVEVKCARYEVFENREMAQGRKIPLNIVVLPASARAKEPDPIFLFAGGPGQAAAELGPQALAILGGLNAKRDIVLIDQRGTGKSNFLNCKMPDIDTPGMAEPVKRDALTLKLIAACRDKLAQIADLTQYTTTIAMADYDEVRAALGYRRINLWGGSYGTRAAMEYLRRYPDQVRSVVIDGVAPPSMALPLGFSRDAGASYDKMLVACDKEPRCAKAFPDLQAHVGRLLASLEKTPRKAAIADPLTGNVRDIEITRDMVLMSVFATLYVPEMSALLPATLHAAEGGNFAPLLSQGALFGDFAEDKIAFGMRMSVVCAEDVPRIAPADAGRESGRAPFGRLFIDEFAKACESWPKGKVPPDFSQPVKSDRPVLLLSGGLDPVTPPVHGEEVWRSLNNALHLVAPNVGHGVSTRGCAPKIVRKFIETASVAGLDGACLQRLPRPMFYEPLQDKKKDAAKPALAAPRGQGEPR